MTSTLEMVKTQEDTRGPLEWEWVRCNLCRSDATDLYHRERLPYFDEMLSFEIVRCRNCGLVYTNPRLVDHNATYLFTDRGDNESIAEHDQTKSRVFARALDEIENTRRVGAENPPARLLDIGCGSGHFLAMARERGFEVCGIEPAPTSADYARQQHGLSIMSEDVLQVDLQAESFDVVTAWDVIEHVPDPQAALRKCVSWLRPGGIMALRFPSARWQKIKGVILHHWLASARPAFSPTMHLFFFNEDTFTQMAEKIGLEVIRIKTTPMESNAGNHILNAVKTVSSMTARALAAVSGAHLGNLEVYCRRANHE